MCNEGIIIVMEVYITIVIFAAYIVLAELACVSRDYGNGGTVCVCNATYCDYVDSVTKIKHGKVLIFTSNLAGLRFSKTVHQFENFSSNEMTNNIDIEISRHRVYQRIQGFGGAFTDATGINIYNLTDNAKEHLMRSYFSKEGIEYNLCRVPIGGTDFSTEAYSYNDGEPDPQLKRFALNRADREYKIPFINVAQNLSNGKLEFFASAWTAPKWMKTNEDYVGGTIKREMYQAWADYYVKFFNIYKEYGIKFWGLTTGNEPSLAKFPLVAITKISSVGWTADTVAKWVAENLGPTLNKTGYGNLNIMVLDDQRLYLPRFIDLVFKNELAKKYIQGTSVHWYMDKLFPAYLLSQLHNKYPKKFILATEASKGTFFLSRGVKLGSWSRAEDYASDIIEDLQNWVTGWIDWNMALNTTGGPTYVNNIADSPIIVNASANEFYKQPMFYAMGHFSKFIPRNSVRIDTKSNKVSAVAFRRPDKGVVMVILNKKKYDQNITVMDDNVGALTLNVSSHSINTLLYW